MKPVTCTKCGASAAIRINRSGFMERRVLGYFGYYPWKCGECGRVFFFRSRGSRPSVLTPAAASTHGSSPNLRRRKSPPQD
jgi:hypothetical protein